MNSGDVISYLKQNPQFFEEHAEAISQLVIPHPYGGRAISISERQILSLREQNRQFEKKMAEMIRFGQENDALSEKLHRLGVAMIAVTTFQSVQHVLDFHLRDDFEIPHVSIQLWDRLEGIRGAIDTDGISKELANFVDTLLQPYCGALSTIKNRYVNDADMTTLFGGTSGEISSLALIALRTAGSCIGVIALGSEEAQRFYSGMGTIYLERLGEMTSAALSRVSRPDR